MSRVRETPDFVLEFVVNYITCRNLNAMASPLSIKIPGCPPIELSPKQTSMTKLTYQKGKRLVFKHAQLLDLNVVFQLHSGHGNLSVRGKCSFDFFEICDKITESDPTVYEVDVTMERSDHSRFGVLNCHFQIFPYRELEEFRRNPPVIKVVPPISTPTHTATSGSRTPRKIVRPVQSARGPPKRQSAAYRSYNSQKGKREDDEIHIARVEQQSLQSKTYRPLGIEQVA
ncbi:hypothetical protein TRFO_17740 [Tritrichomonas foetus]|uniref:Uncharacterized protein n=1 Tax=Tritrichomonas foetus TaxID=1144522 RepID=A0A1J4KMK4_9EUKA|nr:hypothetical protein TRFO_17740 [Tritrichomonas foetus]|eukprot:OHT12459.1 hypothetical protein TRFO_17740 [Tritrichomonas foetus]